MKDVEVSIVCNAYNHENYIRDALESFVTQKTNFLFEILVHDDASTDNTADIIREYEKKYPEKIKPIYQTVNQYSQGVPISRTFHFPRAKGKYIAVCEGDDYWIDPLKLQKQYDAMEKHPEIDVCAHRSIMVNAETKEKIRDISAAKEDTVIPVEEVIAGGGGFVATSSLFYRAEINSDIPQFRKFLGLDYTLQIHSSLRGGMLYLNDCMSAYRAMAKDSWSSKMTTQPDKLIKHGEKVIKMLEILDKSTEYKYSETIKRKTHQINRKSVLTKVSANYPLEKKDYKVIRKMNLKWKVKILLSLKFPALVKKYNRMVRK